VATARRQHGVPGWTSTNAETRLRGQDSPYVTFSSDPKFPGTAEPPRGDGHPPAERALGQKVRGRCDQRAVRASAELGQLRRWFLNVPTETTRVLTTTSAARRAAPRSPHNIPPNCPTEETPGAFSTRVWRSGCRASSSSPFAKAGKLRVATSPTTTNSILRFIERRFRAALAPNRDAECRTQGPRTCFTSHRRTSPVRPPFAGRG